MALGPNASRASEVPPEVRDVAMRGEPDRYIAATLASADTRGALAAIAAFAADVAHIPAVVSEAPLGLIRLQWWEDALEDGRNGRLSGNPVADALIAAAGNRKLPADLLEAVIRAREIDLAGTMPADDTELNEYLQATEGNVFLLGLCAVGANRDEVAALATAAGRAYGIARGLCRLPMQLHNGGVILPAERLSAAGVEPEQLAANPALPTVGDAVRRVADELAAEARSALAMVRTQARQLDRRYRTPLLPMAMVEPYFRAQSLHRILVETVEVTPLRRVTRIGLAHMTGRL